MTQEQPSPKLDRVSCRDTDPLGPTALFGGLPLLRLRLHVTFESDEGLPEYLGFAWRGMLGWELQRLLCPFNRRPSCGNCLVHESCPAWLLLEGRTSLPGLRESPRGCIFYTPPRNGGNQSELQLTLIGSNARFFPLLAEALREGRAAGLGVARNPYRILAWEQFQPDGSTLTLPTNKAEHGLATEPPPLSVWLSATGDAPPSTSVHLASPVRLRREGKYLSTMDWPCFFATLARRLEALNCLHNGGVSIGRERWLDMQKYFAAFAPPETELRWEDWARYSSRQKKRVPMGGLVGTVSLAGCPPDLLPWWQAASLLHVGKGASMGLGRVEIG